MHAKIVEKGKKDVIISSPGQSPGRAIVLLPVLASVLVLAAAAALAKSSTLKFFM